MVETGDIETGDKRFETRDKRQETLRWEIWKTDHSKTWQLFNIQTLRP